MLFYQYYKWYLLCSSIWLVSYLVIHIISVSHVVAGTGAVLDVVSQVEVQLPVGAGDRGRGRRHNRRRWPRIHFTCSQHLRKLVFSFLTRFSSKSLSTQQRSIIHQVHRTMLISNFVQLSYKTQLIVCTVFHSL